MSVDPDLLATWTRGWALTRGVSPPVRDRDAWRIEVGQQDQTRRFVYGGLCDELARRGKAITDPFVFIKVCAEPGAVRPLLSSDWDVRQTGTVMTVDVALPPLTIPDDAYRTQLRSESEVRFATLTEAEGYEAACGRAVRVDDRVIYDRIVVSPEHQRRGLGGRIMRTLQTEMGDWPHGVLVATEQGAKLYSTLGWQAISPYTTAVRWDG